MRLFTGIAIPPHVIAGLEDMLSRLRPLADVKWSPVENLHVTTKFIGEWPEERLAELERALASIDPPGVIPIRVFGFGYFPDARRPKVLFTGVEGGESLALLAQATEKSLLPLGIAREDRPFAPHLTLARLAGADTRALRRTIETIGSPDFGSWQADRFHLYLSRPGERHSIYTALASWPLAKETAAA